MKTPIVAKLLCAVLLGGCISNDAAVDEDGADEPQPAPPDEFDAPNAPPADDGWVPRMPTTTRMGIFYQVSGDVLDHYQAELPTSGHAWIITQSHATAYASKALGDRVHQRADFYYAPAFDIWDDKHDGWMTASDAQLRAWAHDFRDTAIRAHADLFTFNEAPTTTAANANIRVRIAKILRFIHEPDAQGRRLWGVVYFTQKASTGSNWTTPASDFFKAIDDTSIALVVEFYHSTAYTCANSREKLAAHYFSLRDWMMKSGEPAKLSIANQKFTVLHSARFEDGPSGWAGGDSLTTPLARFQRALSRNALVTRSTEGGYNRLAFGPTATQITKLGVQPRITALFNWHYRGAGIQPSEVSCIDGFAGNCECN